MLVALLLALGLIAAACGGSSSSNNNSTSGGGTPQKGGTLTLSAEQFPAALNLNLAAYNLAWDSYMLDPVILGAYQVQPDFSYKPMLLSKEAEVDTGPPFSVTYSIRPDAQWSDGVPVTAKDFEFTWKVFINPKFDVASRDGYDDIASDQIIDDHTIKFTFKKNFAPWKSLFSGSEGVLPEHVLAGQDFNKVWNNCICDPKTGKPIGDGPFLITDFKKNQQVVEERNDNWWGRHAPYLDKIVFPYTPDINTEIQSLKSGESDVIYPTAQEELTQFVNADGYGYTTTAGTFWNHLDFNEESPTQPLLKQLWLRQAIAYAINRDQIVEKLVKPLDPQAETLQNLLYVANQAEYQPHFQTYNYDPAKAKQLLESHGCKMGSDGFYSCNGQELTIGYKSTSGNELRELIFQIVQQELKAVGINVQNQFGEAAVVFGTKGLVGGKYDLFQFGWVGNPDPFSGFSIWECGGDQNYQKSCTPEADKLLEQSNTELDATKRAALINQADALYAKDLPVLPLFQSPDFIAFHDNVHGLQNNATQEGPLWNAADVWIDQGK
jgi:peptide/nickel transport system substrate-binding protein